MRKLPRIATGDFAKHFFHLRIVADEILADWLPMHLFSLMLLSFSFSLHRSLTFIRCERKKHSVYLSFYICLCCTPCAVLIVFSANYKISFFFKKTFLENARFWKFNRKYFNIQVHGCNETAVRFCEWIQPYQFNVFKHAASLFVVNECVFEYAQRGYWSIYRMP